MWSGLAVTSALPVAFSFLHEYQQKRVLIFLDPESDPLGAGYHISQSKIAIGSGGIFGKGFLNGTQSHLDYQIGRDTSELQSLMRISYAVFCLKKKKNINKHYSKISFNTSI